MEGFETTPTLRSTYEDKARIEKSIMVRSFARAYTEPLRFSWLDERESYRYYWWYKSHSSCNERLSHACVHPQTSQLAKGSPALMQDVHNPFPSAGSRAPRREEGRCRCRASPPFACIP